MKKKILVFVCICTLLLTASFLTPASAEETQRIPDIEAGIAGINKYGNIILTIGPESMTELGYEPADMISVRIGEAEMEMPIGTEYTDVDSGDPICRLKSDPQGSGAVVLAINGGNLTETLNIAEYHAIEEDPGFEWIFLNGLDDSVTVCLSMQEKQGYADKYAIHQIGTSRTNNREDYADLSDAEYANFRVIETTGMGEGTLYRSSSPINPALNRNQEADEALLTAQIHTVINMADSQTVMTNYADYGLTNYAGCDIIALDMDMDLYSEAFTRKLAEGFRFLASHNGPYLIHCKEGKDRTGFAAAVLECLMGADADEIVQDYMLTYTNFYGIEKGPQYDEIAATNIEASLAKAFGINSIREEGIQLSSCAEAYLLGIGMTDEEISSLKARLEQDYGGN